MAPTDRCIIYCRCAGKRSKTDSENVTLANEAALGWVTADRLIEAALQSSAVSEKHKAALGGKHDAVKKRARALAPAVLSGAEAAYEAAERDAVAGDVASAMLQWDAEQSGDGDSLDGLEDDLDEAAPAAAIAPAPAPVVKQPSDDGGAAEAQMAETDAAAGKQKAEDEAAAAAKKKDEEEQAAAATAKAAEEEAAAEAKKKEDQAAKEQAEKEAAEKAAKEKEEAEAKAAAPPEPERPLPAEPAPEPEAAAEPAAEGEAEPAGETEGGEAAPEPDAAAEAEAAPEAEPAAGGDDGGEEEEGGPFFSLAELQGGVPPGVDKMRKHEYLSAGEFQEVFGMSKDGFIGLPKWKQNTLKKKMQLF